MWKIIIVISLFIILGGLFIYQNFFLEKKNAVVGSPEIINENEGAIYVPDQRPGSSIVISRIVLSKKGYAVIHEDSGGKPGNVIGNTRLLPEGESAGVVCALIRPTVQGEILFVVTNEDSGDGIFSPDIDIPFRDEEGNIIFTEVHIDKNSPVIELK